MASQASGSIARRVESVRPGCEPFLSDSILVQMSLDDWEGNHSSIWLAQTRAQLDRLVPRPVRGHVLVPPWEGRALVGFRFVHTAGLVFIEVNTDIISRTGLQHITPVVALSTVPVQPILNIHVVMICESFCIMWGQKHDAAGLITAFSTVR